jgi:hypothetical protein
VPQRAPRRPAEVAGGGLLRRAPHCPGGMPPFWAVKRPARPYKRAIEGGFTAGNAKSA